MVLVVGMARSGIAAAHLLRSLGRSVFVSDSGSPAASVELEKSNIPFEAGGHTLPVFLEAEEIIVSPGVPLDIPPLAAARARGISVIGELEFAFRHLQGDIVAITGSNGKTTTTTLTGEILQETGRPVQVGGNIGTALSALVATSAAGTINVVEVSSFQLDAVRTFRPRVGVLLNITPDHLDRYTGFAAYRLSKFRLFENQISSDVAVLNVDDPQVHPPPYPIASAPMLFSQKIPVEYGAFRSGADLFLHGNRVIGVDEIPLRGGHNVENVLAAMAAASCFGVPPARLAEKIRGFRGVEHRIEYVATIRGVQFFNDSKATNVDSSIKAVESFAGNVIMILGGKDKGASYAPLVDAMSGRVKHVLLIGAAAGKISQAVGSKLPKTVVRDLADAVQHGLALAAPGDVVLLSPACASFDMFENYEHRGRVFKDAVREAERGG